MCHGKQTETPQPAAHAIAGQIVQHTHHEAAGGIAAEPGRRQPHRSKQQG